LVRLCRFYPLLNYIIDKAVFLTPLPADLLTLNLSPNGGELALALLTALAQLRPQPDRQEMAELVEMMGAFKRGIEGV
jgi:hypothetical protein